jgi:hypothetical protein
MVELVHGKVEVVDDAEEIEAFARGQRRFHPLAEAKGSRPD